MSAPGEADNDIGGEWAVAVEELRATDDAQSVSEVWIAWRSAAASRPPPRKGTT